MEAFTKHSGSVVPLDRVNVDTDQIIPKQYLKSIKRTGFGDYLFDAWRYLDQGELGMTPNERQINHEFSLNVPRYQGASILLARHNFGCGSSREHAVWALMEFGIRVVIAPSFADIFYNNCFKNGLLPIVLEEKVIDSLFAAAEQSLALDVDLEACVVRTEAEEYAFSIDSGLRQKMLEGLDDIALTLKERTLIEDFEARHREHQPWLFNRVSS